MPGDVTADARKPVRTLPRPSVLDGDILVLAPAEFPETFTECIESECEPGGLGGAHQKETDPRRSLRLLRIGRERGGEEHSATAS